MDHKRGREIQTSDGGLTGFRNTEVAAGVHEIGSVTSRGRLLKTKHSKEQNDVARKTRLHDCFGGYFLNSLVGTAPPRRRGTRAGSLRLAKTCLRTPKCLPERKIHSRSFGANRAQSARTPVYARAKKKRNSYNSPINSPNVATGVCCIFLLDFILIKSRVCCDIVYTHM